MCVEYVGQPNILLPLLAGESDSDSISSDSNTTDSQENSQSRYTDFVSEVVSEKVGYNSDDDDDDIVDHEAEKRPKSMPKKATNNSGPMGTDITNSVEEGFPRKRNLSNSEPSQGES